MVQQTKRFSSGAPPKFQVNIKIQLNAARVSRLSFQAYNFIKKETLAQVFSCEFCKISKNTFSYITPPVDASEENIKLM